LQTTAISSRTPSALLAQTHGCTHLLGMLRVTALSFFLIYVQHFVSISTVIMCTHRQLGGQDELRARLASELVELRRKCAAAEALRDEAVAKATAAAAECERLRADLTAKDKTLSPDQNRAAAAEARASDLESRLAAAQQSAREAAAREQEALSTLKAASSDKSKTDEQMIKTRTELDLVKEQLAAAKQGIANAAQREKEASAALKAAEKDAAAELKRTLTDKDRADKESARLTAELDKARAQASTPHTAFSIKPFRFKNPNVVCISEM
jgi:chromosome segregation ATPase